MWSCLDLNMPVMDGIATLRALRERRLAVRVFMLTISQNDTDLLDAIRAGADGYLLKNTEPEDLRKAILRVAEGQGALSPEVTGQVLRAVSRYSAEDSRCAAQRTRAGSTCLPGRWTDDPANRLAPVYFRKYSEDPCPPHLRKARSFQPR